MPGDWAGGDRRRGGVSRIQAFARNCRNQCSDEKGEAQAAQTARRDTEAEAWGGPIRKSVEGSVMELEQRDRIKASYSSNQLVTG